MELPNRRWGFFASALLLLGCNATGSVKDPTYAGWRELERLAVAEPVLCSGKAMEAYVALDALKAQVAETAGRWTAGKPGCGVLEAEGALDASNLASPPLAAPGLRGLDLRDADALLVTFVQVDETCEGDTSCEASALTLTAFLYDTSGRMVWKSVTERPLGFGFPAPSASEPRELLYERPRHPSEHVTAAR
jgi:hypothetical protein